MKKRDSAETKRRILLAAEVEFSEKGFYGARIDEIARSAEANKKLIYDYFGNKQDLYRAVFINVYSRLAQEELAVVKAEQDAGSPEYMVGQIISLYFTYLQNNPSYINLLMWENLQSGMNVKDYDMSKPREMTIRMVKDIIASGKAKGVFRQEVDTDYAVTSIMMFTFSYFSNRYTLSNILRCNFFDPGLIEKERKNLTEFFLRYLCVPEVLASPKFSKLWDR